jgi:dihydrofolate reductase
MFSSYWPIPQADHELVAQKINSLPKYVFSRSLKSAPWGEYEDARIESGDAAQAVRRLKGEVRGDLILWGSLSLTHSLLKAGSVDVMRLVVLPVAIGSGRGVFPAESGKNPLRLIGSETVDTLVAIDYAIAGAES